MEAPNFESIFECISDGVKSIKFLFLFLSSVKFTFVDCCTAQRPAKRRPIGHKVRLGLFANKWPQTTIQWQVTAVALTS